MNVSYNRRITIIFRPKKKKLTADWRKLHNRELRNFYCSSNIIRVNKSERIGLAENVSHMGEKRSAYKIL
jgi:hypothetical protein